MYMVFFIYTGTVKSFEAFLRSILDLNDQYEISQFIAVQNGDVPLAKKYMKEQNFLISMIEAILGWMKTFPQVWPNWAMIIEKLGGIRERNLMVFEKNVEMQDTYNQNTSPIRDDITRPGSNQFPDDWYSGRGWKKTYMPERSRGEWRWQPRPPPGKGRRRDGTVYPPVGPNPLPSPSWGNDLMDWKGKGGGLVTPPEPPGGWDRDDDVADWWTPEKPPGDMRPVPDESPRPPSKPEDWDWWSMDEATDVKRRCGY